MIGLIYNEMLKMIRKKRIWVIGLILIVLIPIFTYAQYNTAQNAIKQLGTSDWRTVLQQQIIDQQNRLASTRIPEEWKEWTKINIQQMQYYLEHDINPTAPGAPTFMRKFIEQSIGLFLPLLVVILASDIVSSEHASGTIKLLLTRPVPRWKILLSKYLALLFSISLMILMTGIACYLISGIVFGYEGWGLPVITGFEERNGQLVTEHAHLIPQWKYIFMGFGLSWFSCLAVGTISFMVSVLVRSTAASMGVMLAAVISGGLLLQLAPSWNALKYLAFIHLQLTDYLAGQPIMIEGMSLPFSLAVLSVWSILSLLTAFIVFTRRDILA